MIYTEGLSKGAGTEYVDGSSLRNFLLLDTRVIFIVLSSVASLGVGNPFVLGWTEAANSASAPGSTATSYATAPVNNQETAEHARTSRIIIAI